MRYKDVQIARFEHKSGVPLKIGKFTPACDYSHEEVQTKSEIRMSVNQQKSISNYLPGKDHLWKQNYGYRLNGKLILQKKLVESG